MIEKFWGMKNLLKKFAFAALLTFMGHFLGWVAIFRAESPNKSLKIARGYFAFHFSEIVDSFAYNRSLPLRSTVATEDKIKSR